MEKFQNEVIRPVIKMQHDLLIASFQNYLQKRKIDFSTLIDKKKRSKISSIFKTDNNYKNLVLGFILGQFSMEEFSFYIGNPSEINRRILQIVTQRLQDSVTEI